MSLKVFWSLKPSLSDQPGFYDLDLLDVMVIMILIIMTIIMMGTKSLSQRTSLNMRVMMILPMIKVILPGVSTHMGAFGPWISSVI